MYRKLRAACKARPQLTVDVNQAWDGNTARRYLPQLVEAGVTLIEQPVAQWNVEALKHLTATLDGALIMADETVCTPQDAMMLAREKASHVFSLKVAKHGGLVRTRKVAAIAEAADIGWYGGTMLETSLGSAASAMCLPRWAASTRLRAVRTAAAGGRHRRIPDAHRRLRAATARRPRLWRRISLAQLERFDRARQGLTAVHVDMAAHTPTPV
jgi:muconate cycloisomerase (EC 5.5.1.1)